MEMYHWSGVWIIFSEEIKKELLFQWMGNRMCWRSHDLVNLILVLLL